MLRATLPSISRTGPRRVFADTASKATSRIVLLKDAAKIPAAQATSNHARPIATVGTRFLPFPAKCTPARRGFSDKSKASNSTDKQKETPGFSHQSDLVLTPGQKVVAGTRLTLWAGAAVLAATCAYYIGNELLPSKMSPNSVFSKAVNVVVADKQVQDRFGVPLKAYGRDHGGHREGRRNFIEHTTYVDKEDGSKRTRVRFNLEGKHADAFVFAEVSANMASGEFVYVIVQDKRNGRVFTVIDNRSALMAQRMAGGSKEGLEAFTNLLEGGGKK